MIIQKFLIILILLGILFTLPLMNSTKGNLTAPLANAMNADTYTMPLYFIPNQGQVHSQAKFYAKTPQYTLWMTRDSLVFDSLHCEQKADEPKWERGVYRLTFLNTGKNTTIQPVDITSHQVNFIKGNSPAKWHTGIKTSKAILYKNLYQGIHLKVYGNEKQIEYDWIVEPGANPGQIQFHCSDMIRTAIDEKGNLVITTPLGEIIHRRPVSYQENDHPNQKEPNRKYVEVTFRKITNDTYGFKVGDYNRSRELIIDPIVLVYSTFLGGKQSDYAAAIAVDINGCAYVTGDTYSTDFPIRNAYQYSSAGNSRDAYVTKFSVNGKLLVYSTYIGGSGGDEAEGMQVDSNGKVYVTGITASTDFPTKMAYQYTYRGGKCDAFVFALSPQGNTLDYSTYLGGSGDDRAYALALDNSKNIYVTGQTSSPNFPVVKAFQSSFYGGGSNAYDAFITKITASGNTLAYSTYFGGNGKETAWAIGLDSGQAYIAGETTSTDLNTMNPFQAAYGGGTSDAFVTKFSTSGKSLLFSTYLGGSNVDIAWGFDCNGIDSAYVVGTTSSSDFPIENAFQWIPGGDRDIFVTKFDSNNNSLQSSTFLGGAMPDEAAQVKVTAKGSAYITGYTASPNFPTKRTTFNTHNGNIDAIVAMINPDGRLSFSMFLGGSNADYGKAIALDNNDRIYLAGHTFSTDFPIINAYQSSLKGEREAFITKLSTPEIGTLCGAVDNCALPWTTGGDAEWFEQVEDLYHGYFFSDEDGAQSGRVSYPQKSFIQTTVTGPGQFAFNWRITFGYIDRVKFYLDDVYQSELIGLAGGTWEHYTCGIPAGHHTLKWVYLPDYYGSIDTKTWLDNVIYLRNTSIVLDRTQLTFGAVKGSNPPSQTFSVQGSVPGFLAWSSTWEQEWLKVDPSVGIGNNVVTVSVISEELATGTYYAPLIISAPGAANTPQTVSITLHVNNPGKTESPFGTFETPIDHSTVMSSVPFTGWVLDDIGVESVKIYFYNEGTMTYIGDAIMLEGPRPDVEQAFPNYPANYKAGWGYMMLTNFLPNYGNGTFTFTAIATDMEGHEVQLGSKTVTIDNAHAVKPFGAIDTPTQGGTASGAKYINWGWVLTPKPNYIPTNGSSIDVWVNGVKIGKPHYNIYRSDIASFFPGYSNSNGAVGYYSLDTMAYQNGIHSIQWTATDSAGNTDGIGSRYFSIVNPNSQRYQGQCSKNSQKNNFYTASSLEARANEQTLFSGFPSPISLIKGYPTDENPIEPEMLCPNEQGIIEIDAREMERIELHLGNKGKISGWLAVDNHFKPLPIGSYLDQEQGIFYWQIGLAYVGTYTLVFIEEDESGDISARRVLVNIKSKYPLN